MLLKSCYKLIARIHKECLIQREAFARFYFIGDDDLLDIIGNSRDVTNVQRHFPKMYAGIVLLQSEKEG